MLWLLKIRLIGSDVPLMYGKIQKPFAASGADAQLIVPQESNFDLSKVT